MPQLKAGAGRSVITPRVGAALVGYFDRTDPSTGVHDDLHARALVLDEGGLALALCSVELCYLRSREVAQIRQAVAARCDLLPEDIFIFTTHTHAGPAGHNAQDWDRPLPELVADAIVEAYATRQPARMGAGFGQLIGYNINRRWLNRPADPSVAVIRVDTADGKPLAVLGNYACHAVVLGYDNYLISGDWPGYSSRLLEAELGGGTLALFSQGGAGDVNPLTETVRQRLAAAHPVGTIGELTSYYGEYRSDDANTWNIEDRGGGTFLEAETLARAYNAEVMRIWRSIHVETEVNLWTERVTVEGMTGPDEPPAEGLPPEYLELLPEIQEDSIPLEIMLVGIGPTILVGHPGETFSETAVEFRKRGQQMGYLYPMLLTYANGSYAYLPPENAFSEGGYEVGWARRFGLRRHLHDRIDEAILPLVRQHLPR